MLHTLPKFYKIEFSHYSKEGLAVLRHGMLLTLCQRTDVRFAMTGVRACRFQSAASQILIPFTAYLARCAGAPLSSYQAGRLGTSANRKALPLVYSLSCSPAAGGFSAQLLMPCLSCPACSSCSACDACSSHATLLLSSSIP